MLNDTAISFAWPLGRIRRRALVTFFYEEKSEVDRMYELLKDKAKDQPIENPKYRIYHFYASDPEGRPVEFQHFWDEMKEY